MYRDESMNALADKAHKQGMPHSDMHSISSSGTPVGTKFTATYVRIIVK